MKICFAEDEILTLYEKKREEEKQLKLKKKQEVFQIKQKFCQL